MSVKAASPSPSPATGWAVSRSQIDYTNAVEVMETRVNGIFNQTAGNLVWLLEHPTLYTAGTSARDQDLIDPHALPVHKTGRGGEFTYHGPGQRVAYVMMDLSQRGRDVRAYVNGLQAWVISALADLGVQGECRAGRPGVWVCRNGVEDKIAAVGVRVRRWVAFHGVSVNVDPNLEHYSGIIPCGINEHGVTSLHALGVTVTMAQVDAALRHAFEAYFGPTTDEELYP